jgi:hypothetical protein
MGASGVIGGGNLGEQVTERLVSAPVARTASYDTGLIDRRTFNAAIVHLSLGAVSGTTPTYDAKVQHGDEAGGGDQADLSAALTQFGGVAFAQKVTADAGTLSRLVVDLRGAKRYFRIRVTIAGTTPSFLAGLASVLGANVENYAVS